MSDYGVSDISTTTLGANQFPISEVYPPSGTQTPASGGTLTALEGGPSSTDGIGKRSAPVSIYGKVGTFVDGSDATQGFTTDTAVVGDVAGTISAKLRGLSKILNDVWNSTSHYISVNLATAIAGEDIPNNRMMISNELVMSNTNTHAATSIQNGSVGTTTNAVYSSSINCANYRTYAIAGWGASGTIQLLLQVSYDAGNTWQWHPNGFTSSAQFVLQNGINGLIATLCRLGAINTSGSTQNVTAYLCMVR